MTATTKKIEDAPGRVPWWRHPAWRDLGWLLKWMVIVGVVIPVALVFWLLFICLSATGPKPSD